MKPRKDVCREIRIRELIAESGIRSDRGDETPWVVAATAYDDDNDVTPERVREIWDEATADAAADRERCPPEPEE